MATPLSFKIRQSSSELKKIMNSQPEHLRNRIRMLLVCKASTQVLSKHSLAAIIGVNHNSIQNWRSMYVKGGIKKLLEFKKGGYKPSLISAVVHRAIEKKLNKRSTEFRSYKELRQWIHERFVPGINYHTVNKYVKRKFPPEILRRLSSTDTSRKKNNNVIFKTKSLSNRKRK